MKKLLRFIRSLFTVDHELHETKNVKPFDKEDAKRLLKEMEDSVRKK